MDLLQRKLNKSEWESMEKPVSKDELKILNIIKSGFYNTEISYNDNQSLVNFIKIDDVNDNMHFYLYKLYFKDTIEKLLKKYSITGYNIPSKSEEKKTIKKVDSIKIDTKDANYIKDNTEIIYEFIIIEIIQGFIKNYTKGIKKKYAFYYYTLCNITNNSITNVNPYVFDFQNFIINNYKSYVNIKYIIENATDIIEKNAYLTKFKDITLYSHQKDIINNFNNNKNPFNLVLYIAPTATGKTLTPIALSEKYKIIFVCAARHVGIALSKSAISVGKKIAFGFGCDSPADIRLHWSAASKYIKHDRTGTDIKYKDGKKKVDNSHGEKVEIMICDLVSYNAAMNYMLNFNKSENIITYWDEPTISLDYNEHNCHQLISENWSKNVIPNVILSSATLPDESEIESVINDFKSKAITIQNIKKNLINKELKKLVDDNQNRKNKAEIIRQHIKNTGFMDSENEMKLKAFNEQEERILTLHQALENFKIIPANITTIKSHDSTKSISILNKDGFAELPHYIFDKYSELSRSIRHIKENKTILRYLDLTEISRFIVEINNKMDHVSIIPDNMTMNYVFTSISDITMNSLKEYYLELILSLKNEQFSWSVCRNSIMTSRKLKIDPPAPKLKRSYSVGHNTNNPIVSNNVFTHSNSVDSYQTKSSNSLVKITTEDSYTLTDGPTIYIAENVDKIAKYCLQTAEIPSNILDKIHKAIAFNNELAKKVNKVENNIEDKMAPFEEKENRISKNTLPADIQRLKSELDQLLKMFKCINLPDCYVPNKKEHIQKWASQNLQIQPFTSNITDKEIEKVMSLSDVDDIWKVVLLMGIGLFSQNTGIAYTEVVKELAVQQKLYLIIANGDYIYGTNYQFCHGYLSKDMLTNITQEKCIQAMGRIGRNKFQMDYTIRFRDNDIIKKLFTYDQDKPESRNMCRLFTTNFTDLQNIIN